MIKNKLLITLIIFSFLFLLTSCKSKEEISIISQIQKNNFIDLSVYCKQFDKIIIYDEGYYYYDNNKEEWIGPKIYYFFNGKIEKVINMRYCPADVPYGTIIYFYPYTDGKIILSKGNTIFYLTQIEKYKTGKLLRLENQKKTYKYCHLNKHNPSVK
jgi:lipoprotein